MTDEPTPGPASPRPPLLPLRTALILTIGLLVATGIAVMCVLDGGSGIEVAAAAGGAFAGVVTFLHEIIE